MIAKYGPLVLGLLLTGGLVAHSFYLLPDANRLCRWYTSDKMKNFGERLATLDFSYSCFKGRDFSALDLSDLKGVQADFRDSDFHGTKLRGAFLALSDLRGCDLRGADLTESVLDFASLDGARFDSKTMLPFSLEEAARRGMIRQ